MAEAGATGNWTDVITYPDFLWACVALTWTGLTVQGVFQHSRWLAFGAGTIAVICWVGFAVARRNRKRGENTEGPSAE
jgi:hypothetical protein